jgi:flagellar basal-body rod protein FlgC
VNIFRIFNVSGADMSAQRTRMSVVAGNLANAETTRTPEGGPYRRRNVFFRTLPLQNDFPSLLQEQSSWPLQLRRRDSQTDVNSVEVVKVQASTRAPRKVYDPQHPDADTEGYVSYPDINTMEEMTDLLSATRSYEANLTTFNTTKALVRKLLEMGRL